MARRWPEHFGGSDPAASLADIEQRTLDALRAALERNGVEPCVSSSKLTAAARAHARHLLAAGTPPGRIDADMVRREARREGAYDPTVVPWAIGFHGDIDLESRVARLARRVASRPPTHCGIGHAVTDERQVLVVVGVRRRVQLEAVPSRLASGNRVRLEGTLAPGYQAPAVMVTSPLGEVGERQVLRRAGWFGTWLELEGVGRHTVEVMATGPRGPEIVALFPISVDSEPWEGTDEDMALAVRPVEDLASIAARLLELLNLERQQAGLLPLMHSSQLDRLAANHSRDMLMQGYFGHVSPGEGDLTARLRGAGISTPRAAENLVRSVSSSRAHDRLMESPSHRANILDPSLTHVGIGLARSAGELVVTQIFVSW